MIKISAMSRLLWSHLKQFPRFPFYAYLAGICPILILFASNQKELDVPELYLPILAAIFISTTLLLLFRLLLKSWHKSAVMVAVLLLTVLSYGYFMSFLRHNIYQYINLNRYSFGEDKIVFSLLATLLIGLLYTIYRSPRRLLSITRMLNVFFVALLVWPVVSLAGLAISPTITTKNNEVQAIAARDDAEKPSIYYLIFDKYGSNETLKNYYGFDNSTFTEGLKQMGFYVVEDARTNYPKTSFSLGSSLNMDYLQTFKPELSDDREEVSIVFPLLQHPKVAKTLQSIGYKYYHVSSWYEPTKTSAIADEVINYDNNRLDLSRFQKLLLHQTALAPIVEKSLPLSNYAQQLDGLQYEFEHLPEVVAQSGPKFVFVHVLLPHDPFVYDQNCDVVTKEAARSKTKIQNYLGQVGCANSKATSLISDIQTNDPDAIIVFQSDEGPADYKFGMTEDYDFEASSHDSRMIRTGIQLAFHFPDGDYSRLYQGMTPVNIFRTVFSQYFDQGYPLLPDKTYVMKSKAKLFEFMDVTNEVRARR